MPDVNIVVGNDGINDLQGGAGKDLIYGFDPNGPQGEVSSITATRVASGLSRPLYAAAAPGDSQRLFVVEQTGSIKIVDLASGTVNPVPFLTVPVDSTSERGLLGLAFDPNYATNGFFYIYRTVPGATPHNEVDRYHVSADPNVADAASLTSIISLGNLSATNHNGGWIGFGPDGDLYIATGENAIGSNSQTLNNLLGKILRIHPDGQIPTDNPFYNTATGDNRAIYALGLRNPFRDSFDRATGDFYIADVGQGTIEEINAGIKGANYGWPSAEGPSGNPAFTNPIFSYDHTVGQAVIGGYVYRGTSEGLQGQYFFADEVSGKVFTMRFNGSAWVATERTSQITTDHGAIDNPASFGEDAQGNLCIVDIDGDVFRLTPNVVSADQNDTLRGFAGDDMMFGGSGNDLLDGGTDNDTMTGGPGDDRFVFAPGYDADTINDFVAGAGTADKIDLTAFHLNFGSILALAEQSGGNTVFNFGGGDTLTLLNVSKADLSPDDFVGFNQAPQISFPNGNNIPGQAGQVFAASSLFSVTDADNDTLTYFLYDWSSAANSGHLVVNGAIVPAETVIALNASQLAHTTFVAGARGTSDDLAVMAFDGHDYSGNTSFSPFNVNVAANHAPVVTVPSANVAASAGQVFAASSLFSVGDLDNDALTYFLYDWSSAANSGHLVVNGAIVPAETVIALNASQLAHTTFVAGSAGTSDDLGVMAFDGHDYSGNTSFNDFHIFV